ncbi:MAG TPA: PKD domain-containing protein [Candidatus Angelobacter sp.]|nr:PKD domain-containing protein [Candidatus Angelobacter sp.]
MKANKKKLGALVLCAIVFLGGALGFQILFTSFLGPAQAAASISLVSTAPCTVSCGQGPTPYLTGWGAVKLAEVETTTGGVNDFEAHLQLLQKMGYNAVRVEWQSPCIANEGSGAYSSADFQKAASLAQKYNIWLIMDWLSGTDVGSSCWLNNWQSIVSYADSNINYTQIIWEPENEPMSTVGITQLTSGYQSFLNMARQMGDNRWVVVSNLCIQSCESNPSPGGWPVINDTAQHVFMDWHSYMYYPYWSSQGWTNAVADTAANFDYQFTLSALQVCSWCKLINTEIGADPIGGSPPDATPSGASGDTCDGYTAVTVHFVQDLVNLFKSANISWTGWGIGSWLTNVCGSNPFEGNLSGQISYGALQSPLGWGLQLKASQVGPDFGLSASPSSVSVMQGAAGTAVITLTSSNSFNGTVTLSGAPPLSSMSVTASPSSLTLTAGGQRASTLTISTTSSTPVGGYAVTVTGTSGGLSNSVTMTLTVTSPPPAPDFAISSSQVTLAIVQGSSDTSTITLTSLSGFAGAISLTSSISTSSAIASLGSSSLTLSAGGSGTVTVTVSTVSSTLAGTFSASVTGASGSLSHSVTISVTVTPPSDFGLAASPSSISIPSGSSGSVTLTLSSLNGFTGSLSLAMTAPSSGIALSLNTSSLSLSSGGQVGSTLTISPSILVSSATYTLGVTGTGSGLSHSIVIPITVSAPVIQPLQGAVSWGPTAPVTGQTVTFTANATNGVQPYSFGWDFGDGSTGSGATVSHVYSHSGTCTVKLVVIDASSITVAVQSILKISAVSTLVTVPGPETAPLGSILSFTVNASIPSGQGPISISATNLPPGASFTSTSGNPATGTFSWTPARSVQPGLYTVTFNAVQAGSTYSASKSVAINVPAAASGASCLFLCQVHSEVWSLVSLILIGATVGLLLTTGVITFSRAHRSRPRGLPPMLIPRLSMPSRVSVSPLYGNMRNTYGSSGHSIPRVHKPTSRRKLGEKIHTQSSAFKGQKGVRSRRKLR